MLCTATFPGLKYLNREAPDEREFAESAPRTFLIHRIPCAPMPRPIVVADAIPNPLVRILPIFQTPTGILAKQRIVMSLLRCRNPPRTIVRARSKIPALDRTALGLPCLVASSTGGKTLCPVSISNL